jgi:hypothetical protein
MRDKSLRFSISNNKIALIHTKVRDSVARNFNQQQYWFVFDNVLFAVDDIIRTDFEFYMSNKIKSILNEK